MDVISVYQAGVENIVATLGTALTESQAKLLMKYTGEIVLCYDSDEAGQAATKRAIAIINSVGGRCRVMRLKDAKDPDEYIRSNGKDGLIKFRNLIEQSNLILYTVMPQVLEIKTANIALNLLKMKQEKFLDLLKIIIMNFLRASMKFTQ